MSELDLEGEVRALFREKFLEFIAWTQETFKITDADRKEDWLAEKSVDYCEGYNAGIEAFPDAFKVWMEEFGP